MEDNIALTIEYDLEKHPETNGYYETYLDLYLAEFTENLQWYPDNLDYSEGWTWFNADGTAMSDEQVAAMTTEDKAEAFINGYYTKAHPKIWVQSVEWLEMILLIHWMAWMVEQRVSFQTERCLMAN